MEEIAVVYARSLFEVASESGSVDRIRTELGEFADALDGSRELSVFFFSPYFSTEEKKEGLRKAISDASPAVVNFLELLVENHRMPAIHRIRRQFEQLWQDANKVLPVLVTSAIELDKKQLSALEKQIADQTGRNVELNATVDEDILGGIVLRVGNTIVDASIRHRLDQLRRQVARA